ncbi:hypothetical protein LLEC1_06152 [Akanthomyces lecanii]|uniref:DUF1365 domain-containing protein n=1 Tax=Cordyceps confragosa TaxID=2714763 RepID=A0A179IAL3_CORDF|nr:hypothetical protein LLEC1_06152 [Akanthomyces lecanii]
MDSVDDTPLTLAVVRFADYADRFLQNWPGSIFLSASFTLYYSLFGGRQDVVLIAAAAALASPSALWQLLARHAQHVLGAVLIVACIVISIRFMILSAPRIVHGTSARRTESAGSFFIPSRTTHSRLFPKKHSFAYSYLTVGIPVGLRTHVNGILSVDPFTPRANRGWWAWLSSPLYEVDSANHLARGVAKGGLREKLNNFLSSQSTDPSEYPHAFLVTAPKFLGYSFNPVSFWYLYSADKVLSAMILEVNNTFDERRPYLVFRDFDQDSKLLQGSDPTSPTEKRPSKISASLVKDFHVSPFNSRKGSYSLMAQDPLGSGMASFRGLDVTINLRSSKGHPKLVARLVNQGDAIDVANMTVGRKILFVLHVWSRPEPLPQSLGRHATPTERQLEVVFREYLRYRVEQSPKALRVRYVASGIGAADPAAADVFASKTASTASACNVEMRVLTPVFYARFVHYAHDFEGLFNELAESCTLDVDKPDMLPHIFLKRGAPPFHASSLTEYLYFRLIQALRRRPEAIRRPLTSAETSTVEKASSLKPVDIRGFRISSMDAYVLEHGSDSVKSMYRSAVSRLFLADRFFLGSLELLSAVEFIWRAGVAYLFLSAFYTS